MSPSASTATPLDTARKASVRSRGNSAMTILPPAQDSKATKPLQLEPQIQSTDKTQTHYTVFIRLPFARNGFQDPPPVEWDSVKDKALWKLISKASNSKELDWEGMSARFDVSLSFLLQQAAWLYERHFEGMRAQMKRLGVSSGVPSGTVTPAPEGGVKVDGSDGVVMQRTGSKGRLIDYYYFPGSRYANLRP